VGIEGFGFWSQAVIVMTGTEWHAFAFHAEPRAIGRTISRYCQGTGTTANCLHPGMIAAGFGQT
jgi:hypothetical protein